ncbi:MAG TPA: hypothetical protein VLK34_07280 [Nocardioidaceae bacterium]|nr:hypothetical protein [Nocardioidaceae bacterium]
MTDPRYTWITNVGPGRAAVAADPDVIMSDISLPAKIVCLHGLGGHPDEWSDIVSGVLADALTSRCDGARIGTVGWRTEAPLRRDESVGHT